MIRGYANSGQAGKSYIGAIAELLMRYPRSVALKCADPFAGVPRETKFLPTPADVIAWCERQVAPMHEEATREDRVNEQLRAREEWQNEQKDPILSDKMKAWLDRTDPVAQALTGEGPHADATKREEQRKVAAAELGKRSAQVQAEWGNAPAPTIAGLPISRELADKLGALSKREESADAA